LPDGLSSNQKSQFLVKFAGPWKWKCCYRYFMTICNSLRPFGIHSPLVYVVCGLLVYFSVLLRLDQGQIWQTCTGWQDKYLFFFLVGWASFFYLHGTN
jgi:hypothetical protein